MHPQALAHQQISDLDWQHLQEKISALGRQEYREMVSRLTILLGHLLKWELQPEKRSRSWFLTIREQRRSLRRHLKQNPSVKARLPEALEEGFEAGTDQALRETACRFVFFRWSVLSPRVSFTRSFSLRHNSGLGLIGIIY